MKKFLFPSIVFLPFLLASCFQSNVSAVSVCIPERAVKTILANISATSFLECECSISGDYSAVQTVPLSSQKTVEISFGEVPAGSKVKVSAVIYSLENNMRFREYGGTSPEITVVPGENTVPLTLSSISDSSEISLSSLEFSLESALVSEDSSWTSQEVSSIAAQKLSASPLKIRPKMQNLSVEQVKVSFFLNGVEQKVSDDGTFELSLTNESLKESNIILVTVSYGGCVASKEILLEITSSSTEE